MSFQSKVGERLKSKEMNYTELCRKVGMDKALLSRYVNGKQPPPIKEDVLRKLGDALELDWHVLQVESMIDRLPNNLQSILRNTTIRRFVDIFSMPEPARKEMERRLLELLEQFVQEGKLPPR